MSAIHDTILRAAALIGPISKDSFNAGQKFRFRGIDAVMNRCSKVFTEVGLFVTPHVISHASTVRKTNSGGDAYNHIVTMQFEFRCAGGEEIVTCTTVGEASDSGDKGASKAMAIALKYALFITLMIPLDAQDDPDAHSGGQEPQIATGAPVAPELPAAETLVARFLACTTLANFNDIAGTARRQWATLTEAERKAVKATRDDAAKRVGTT